jgi:hypothetical protein
MGEQHFCDLSPNDEFQFNLESGNLAVPLHISGKEIFVKLAEELRTKNGIAVNAFNKKTGELIHVRDYTKVNPANRVLIISELFFEGSPISIEARMDGGFSIFTPLDKQQEGFNEACCSLANIIAKAVSCNFPFQTFECRIEQETIIDRISFGK